MAMGTESIFILLFIVSHRGGRRGPALAIPYTVALVVTGLGLGMLHLFEAPHLTKADAVQRLFAGPAVRGRVSHRVPAIRRTAWPYPRGLALPGVVAAIVLTSVFVPMSIARKGGPDLREPAPMPTSMAT